MALTSAIRDADAIYFGTTEADRVYVGSELLYEGTFDPASISGLALWFKADAITGNDGDAVSQWDDSSGNARNAAQGTSAARPTYQTGEINGKPVVRFDGVDDSLDTGALSAFVTGTAMTVFVVGRRIANSSSTNDPRWLALLGSGATNDFDNAGSAILYDDETGDKTRAYRNGALLDTARIAAGTAAIYEIRYDGTNVNYRVNGVDITATASTGSFTVARAVLGAGLAGSSIAEHHNVDLAEVLVCDSSLDATNRTNLRDYLTGRFALPA